VKPDWKDAPYWCQYLACDLDGMWVWHEYAPMQRSNGTWVSKGRTLDAIPLNDNWRETKEKRPS
jgi:hypothetical protein